MAHTYTKLTYHAVFSTKGRRQMIAERLRHRLHPYVGSVINGQLGLTGEIGGTADHIHVLSDVKRLHRQRVAGRGHGEVHRDAGGAPSRDDVPGGVPRAVAQARDRV